MCGDRVWASLCTHHPGLPPRTGLGGQQGLGTPALLLLAVGGREGRERVASEGSRLSTDATEGSLQRRSGPAPPTTWDGVGREGTGPQPAPSCDREPAGRLMKQTQVL